MLVWAEKEEKLGGKRQADLTVSKGPTVHVLTNALTHSQDAGCSLAESGGRRCAPAGAAGAAGAFIAHDHLEVVRSSAKPQGLMLRTLQHQPELTDEISSSPVTPLTAIVSLGSTSHWGQDTGQIL